MTIYQSENQLDLFRDLQIVSEGDVIASPSLFGGGSPNSPVFPTNPTFKFFGVNQMWKYEYRPEGFPIQALTDENRTKEIVIKKSALLDVDFDLVDYTYNGILAFLLGLNDTNFTSYASFFSRKPASTEYFTKNFGMAPVSTTLSLPDDNKSVHVKTQLIVCNPVVEDTTGPTIGSGSYASAISGAPIKPSDGGIDSFSYNSTMYKTRGMDITVEPQYAIIDADDHITTQHMAPVRRTITGKVNIFKKQGVDSILSDITSDPKTYRTVSRVLKPAASGTRIDLTNVLMSDNYPVDNSSIKSNSTIQEFAFTAGGLTLVNLP